MKRALTTLSVVALSASTALAADMPASEATKAVICSELVVEGAPSACLVALKRQQSGTPPQASSNMR